MLRLRDNAGLHTQVVLAICTGSAVAVVETMAVGTGETGVGRGVALLVSVGLVAGAAALLGVFQAAALWGWGWLAARTGVADWWRRATTRDVDGARGAVVAFHAGTVSVVACLVVFGTFVWLVTPRLLAIDNTGFARSFAVVFLGTALVATVAGGFVVGRILVRPVERLDRRLVLPWPKSGALRYIAFVVFPVAGVLVPFVVGNRTDLGTFALPFVLLLFFVAEAACLFVWRAIVTSERWARRQLWVVAAAGVATVVAAVVLNRSEAAVKWSRTTSVANRASALLRNLTDLDRDGYSSLFGGGDCAAFDPQINPRGRDEPGNDIDENCDGEDAAALIAGELAPYSEALTPEQVRPYNVVLVIVDALRADYTGLGGSKKRATPYLDALGKEALVFTNAYSQSPATQLSFPSILTGRDPSSLPWQQGKRIEVAPNQPSLASLVAAAGYETGIVAVDYFEDYLDQLQSAYAWSKIVPKRKQMAKTPQAAWYTGRAGPITVEAIRFLEARASAKTPTFLTIYIPEPHAPYARHSFGISRYKGKKVGRYTGEIANADRHLGLLVEYLKYSGQWDDTIVIVTADHGEEFEEHGGKEHARTCYVESTHVPLVVYVPGFDAQEVEDTVAVMDVVPTVLELVGATDGATGLDGQSLLVPALAPELRPQPRYVPCAVISQRARQGNFFRRAVRTDGLLLVQNVIEGSFELYDTKEDPKEQSNVYAQRQDDPAVALMRQFLTASQTGNLADSLVTD